jgi:large subunit ribosomal protein L4
MATQKKAIRAKKVTQVKRPAPVKSVKAEVMPKKKVKKTVEVHGLTVSVIGTDGKLKGKMTLPEEVFGEKMNKQLIAQAVRVYLANQRAGGASTKTRGMVEGSTRKIYRQKGTGRARHGGIRAPIFIGGGIAFGPVPHDFSLSMPVRMKRKALACALTSQYVGGNVIIAGGLETLKPKTKFMAKALLNIAGDGSVLLVVTKDAKTIIQIARNIDSVHCISASDITTYDVLSHKKVIFMKDAVATVKEIITKEL